MQNTDFPFERSQTVEYGPTGPVFMQGCLITAESSDIKKKDAVSVLCVCVCLELKELTNTRGHTRKKASPSELLRTFNLTLTLNKAMYIQPTTIVMVLWYGAHLWL